MSIQVTLACGCRMTLDTSASEPPLCPSHQERRIQAVHAPPPRFTARDCQGAAMGPLVRHAD